MALPRRVARMYPAYGLYLYGEGLYAQETQALKLTGAPVLFLPGNAGSYKQGKNQMKLKNNNMHFYWKLCNKYIRLENMKIKTANEKKRHIFNHLKTIKTYERYERV